MFRSSQWLLHGGLQTLSSFGVRGISPSSRAEEFVRLRDAFVSEVGADLINWLRDMPTIWRSGNIAVTHAGADPTKAIDVQKPQTLRWGHPEFLKTSRTDGIWIIHGHTVVDAPEVANGRVAIDTGAYATGVLTATVAEANKFSFLFAQ